MHRFKTDKKKNIPARTSPGLTRSSFATTRNRVTNDICVPRNILRDTPDLSYFQPEGNYYFKTSDSYQILKSCSINILDCLKSPGTCDSSPCISNLTGKTYYTKSVDPLDCSTLCGLCMLVKLVKHCEVG